MAPVVALHSLFFDGRMFNDLSRLTRREVHAPDHRGQGSRAQSPGSPTIDRLADDTIVELERLDEPAHLVGSSMGAYVAIVTSARRPDLVRSVVLSAATAGAEMRPELFDSLVADLRETGAEAQVDRIADTMFGQPFIDAAPASLHTWKARFASRAVSIADAAACVFSRRSLWDEAAAIDVPLLLLAGAHDRAKSPADMNAISERVGCAPPVVFHRSGHTPFVEEPEAVSELLASWWARSELERNVNHV